MHSFPQGQSVRLDEDAESQDSSFPAFVSPPDGDPAPVICEPSPGRRGVYAFRFDGPVLDEGDLLRNLHAVLPQLKAFHAQALANHPESTNGGVVSES